MNAILPRNEHVIDRIIRVVIGVGLLSLVWIGPQTAWGWVGLVPLVTGLIGSCPVYRLFGVSTRSIGEHETPPSST
ncbi:MAG: DUF2892 domain-containing protein [Myxococcales bacterium]|jgi:hypothetical protein